ncbi:Serine carboxypeptidase 1 [Glycine soja]
MDNYLKGIINSALKGLDDTPQPKSKAGARPLEAKRLKALRIQWAQYYLKGYMVGNGVTDEQIDGNALVPFVHGMRLIPDELFEEVNRECNGNFYDPTSDNCSSELSKLFDEINIYNILEPCYHGTEAEKIIESYIRMPSSFQKLGKTKRPFHVRKKMLAPVRDGIVPTWPQLMNRKSAPPCTKSVVSSWDLCTDRIYFDHDAGSMTEYHKNLTSKGYRALIFSNDDHDMCVPYTGSQVWMKYVRYKIVDEWRPWSSNGQVAGYTQGYDKNLTFLTIKGSGHTVLEYKP